MKNESTLDFKAIEVDVSLLDRWMREKVFLG